MAEYRLAQDFAGMDTIERALWLRKQGAKLERIQGLSKEDRLALDEMLQFHLCIIGEYELRDGDRAG